MPQVINRAAAPSLIYDAIEPFTEAIAKADWGERSGAETDFDTKVLRVLGLPTELEGDAATAAIRSSVTLKEFKLYERLSKLADTAASWAEDVANPQHTGYGRADQLAYEADSAKQLDKAIAKLHALL